MLALVLIAALQAGDLALTPEQRDLFARLDRFDPRDTTDYRFVEVRKGVRGQPGEPAGGHAWYGFLIEEQGESFTVVSIERVRSTLRTRPAGGFDFGPYHWRPADLRAHAADFVRRLALPIDDAWEILGEVGPRARALLLARDCAKHGFVSEARALLVAIAPFERVRDEVVEGLATQLTWAFGNASRSPANLLARHRAWLAAFADFDRPHTSAWIRRCVASLQAQRIERREKPLPEPAERTPHDWCRALRGEFLSLSDRRSLTKADPTRDYSRLPDGSPSPVDALLALGVDAVPALIDALSDSRMTRCVSAGSGPPVVVPVSCFARELLVEISGQHLSGKDAWLDWWKARPAKRR